LLIQLYVCVRYVIMLVNYLIYFKTDETIIQAYIRLDNTIGKIEADSPGPRLSGLLPMLQESQEVKKLIKIHQINNHYYSQ